MWRIVFWLYFPLDAESELVCSCFCSDGRAATPASLPDPLAWCGVLSWNTRGYGFVHTPAYFPADY
eukprot:2359340-Amphidinium_carterae.1